MADEGNDDEEEDEEDEPKELQDEVFDDDFELNEVKHGVNQKLLIYLARVTAAKAGLRI